MTGCDYFEGCDTQHFVAGEKTEANGFFGLRAEKRWDALVPPKYNRAGGGGSTP